MRSVKVPGKLDLVKQAAFLEKYKELKAGLQEGEEIFFGDAVHPEYQSQSVAGWILKNEIKTLGTTARQELLHFIGAVELNEIDSNQWDDQRLLEVPHRPRKANAVWEFYRE